MNKNLENLLVKLAESAGLGSLELDENGECGLVFDKVQGVFFKFSQTTDELQITASLGEYREEDELATLRALVEANYGWAGTGGGTLGADTRSRQVLLSHREHASDLSWVRLEQILGGFLNTAFFWREKLAQGIKPAEESAPPPFHAISV